MVPRSPMPEAGQQHLRPLRWGFGPIGRTVYWGEGAAVGAATGRCGGSGSMTSGK
jgi:hypothetical protein